MTPEARDELLAMLDHLSIQLGKPNCETLIALLAEKSGAAHRWLASNQTRAAIATTLGGWDVTEEDVKQFVDIARFIPEFTDAFATRIFRIFSAKIPSRMGRPQALTPEQAGELCDFISKLDRAGVPMSSCYERATLHFNVSLKTAKRTYRQRKDFPESPRLNREEAWKQLTGIFSVSQ